MKKTLALSSLMIALFASGAVADNGWGLHWSYWKPKDGDAGFGPGFKLSVEVMPHAQLDLRAAYFNKFEMKKDGLKADIEVTPLEIGLVYTRPLNDSLDLFAGFGGGYYLMDGKIYEDDGARSGASPGDKIGYYASIGLEVALSKNLADYGANRVTLLVEGIYRMVEGDDMTRASDSRRLTDPSLGGPALNIGLMVRW